MALQTLSGGGDCVLWTEEALEGSSPQRPFTEHSSLFLEGETEARGANEARVRREFARRIQEGWEQPLLLG